MMNKSIKTQNNPTKETNFSLFKNLDKIYKTKFKANEIEAIVNNSNKVWATKKVAIVKKEKIKIFP